MVSAAELHPEYSRLLKPSPVAWGIQIAMRRDEHLQCTSPGDRFGRFLAHESAHTDGDTEVGTRALSQTQAVWTHLNETVTNI